MLRKWVAGAQPPSPRFLVLWTAGIFAVLGIGGLIFAVSGLYNVSASAGHWSITRALLEVALQSSVRTQSLWVEAPPLDEPGQVQLGAAHFAAGCAPCHGAPGQQRNAVTQAMVPEPPHISQAIEGWSTEELFWIVRHGIKMTGMPAWPSQQREDEVWNVVAFLQRVPGMTGQEYRALADPRGSGDLAAIDEKQATLSPAFLACGRCHETADAPSGNPRVPRLAGQSARYLEAALSDYASGNRFSGIMQSVASELDADSITRLAAYYAELPPPAAEAPPASPPESIARGRQIAETGVPEERVPACLACHDARANLLFPRLAGQPALYLATQLRLWKTGGRGHSTTSAIMKPVAEQLTEAQMRDVAAYFASLPPDGGPESGPRAAASDDAGAPQ